MIFPLFGDTHLAAHEWIDYANDVEPALDACAVNDEGGYGQGNDDDDQYVAKCSPHDLPPTSSPRFHYRDREFHLLKWMPSHEEQSPTSLEGPLRSGNESPKRASIFAVTSGGEWAYQRCCE